MAARRLHNLIYITIANCCLYIAVVSVAIGTNKWFIASVKDRQVTDRGSISVSASYGLFEGKKTKDTSFGDPEDHILKIVCEGTRGCMFSCGTTANRRKVDIQLLLDGLGANELLCNADAEDVINTSNFTRNSTGIRADGDNIVFINFGLYVVTIMFLGLGMIFAVVSGVLALYNTYRTPIQPVLSVLGLYIWNGLSAAFVVLGMIMWIIEFATRLRKNAAISETLSGDHDSSGGGSLGVSFWILFLPIIFSVANLALLKYRSWKIVKMNENNVKVMMTGKNENGDTLLF